MEFVYPAIFEAAEEGGFIVAFPDFNGAVTEGDDLSEALDMAEDCLGGLLVGLEEDGKKPPAATPLAVFPANSDNAFVSLVKIDLTEYKKKLNEKPIKKTLYIPKALNDKAEAQGINFSQVLRDALREQLG